MIFYCVDTEAEKVKQKREEEEEEVLLLRRQHVLNKITLFFNHVANYD